MTSSFSRRSVLQGTGAAAALVTLSGCFSSEANNSNLAQPGPLKEMTIGNKDAKVKVIEYASCLLYTSPSPRDLSTSRMPSSA